MAVYEFENEATGQRREVVASMKSPPPEFIYIDREGGWHKVPNLERGAVLLYRRLYGAGLGIRLPEYGLTYKGAPASRQLPRRDTKKGQITTLDGHKVVRHKDGGYTLPNGQPLIRNKADRDRECSRTGFRPD